MENEILKYKDLYLNALEHYRQWNEAEFLERIRNAGNCPLQRGGNNTLHLLNCVGNYARSKVNGSRGANEKILNVITHE